MNRADEPPPGAWMNRSPRGDDRNMTHLMNVLCSTLLVYASVTRGGLAVARGFELIARRSG